MTPGISFVIPVRNDEIRLERCLKSIRAAAVSWPEIEIIVMDNGSRDGSVDVARRYSAQVLVVEHVRVAELRNQGARRAAGEVLAFVDADNEIAGGWIQAVVENLRADNVANPALPGLAALGVAPTAVEAVVPTYLWRFRKGGQFAVAEAARA